MQAEAADCVKCKSDPSAVSIPSRFIRSACLVTYNFRRYFAIESYHFLDDFAPRDTASPGWLRTVFVRCL